jgi:cytochrome c oxidase subunit 2
MAATLRVVDAATYRPATPEPPPPAATDAGYRLLEAKECLSCHSMTADADLAPSFKGIYGRTQKLHDGSVITIDEAYLRESIVHPSAKLVNGYDDLMPEPTVTKEEVEQMIQYLKTIK